LTLEMTSPRTRIRQKIKFSTNRLGHVYTATFSELSLELRIESNRAREGYLQRGHLRLSDLRSDIPFFRFFLRLEILLSPLFLPFF